MEVKNTFIFLWTFYCATYFFHTVSGGEFMYLPFPAGSRPNITQAEAICASYGHWELAILDSQAEYDRMLSYLNQTLGPGFVLPTAFWMGSYGIDIGGVYTHVWRRCNKDVPVSFMLWDSGEPDGMYTQNCMRVHTNMLFRTIGCSSGYDVMCEKKVYSETFCPELAGELQATEECAVFARCWWTPAKVGLTAGFMCSFTFFILCCIGWKCFCGRQNQVGYEQQELDDEEEEEEDSGSGDNGDFSRPHNIFKNHNVDHSPFVSTIARPTIGSVVLKQEDAPWMSPEELSFSSRYAYKE